jgi:NAD(P)H-hydrate epimerase
MNVYSSSKIRAWDSYTISHEPIPSIDLMERAARKLLLWIAHRYTIETPFMLFCGRGNNGGDGLALARMLFDADFGVQTFLLSGSSLTADCKINLERLHNLQLPVTELESPDHFTKPDTDVVIIDALLGTGLTRPVEGKVAEIIRFLNSLPNTIISIDMPSGLPADNLPANSDVVHANVTLSFQCPKYSFFLPENEHILGDWQVLDIGLHPLFSQVEKSGYHFVDAEMIKDYLPPTRGVFSHKGHFGHAVLSGGSEGMMGAMIMAATACLKSGAGLHTLLVPEWGRAILQTSIPEAMCYSQQQMATQHTFYTGKTAVGVGMGWVGDEYHAKLLQWLISNVTAPLLIDATGLNLLAKNPEWLALRPPNSATVLTPHTAEFVRLTGLSANSVEQLEKAKRFASDYGVFIILKGAYTRFITPGGLVYFNSTGNPGMAKGGSGDVLAGLITGLLAKGLAPAMACLLGVYLHGAAGDIAASQKSQTGMTAMDIAEALPEAWKSIGVA